MSRLQELYAKDLAPRLRDELGLANVMEVPRITKVTLNMGVGEPVADKKILDNVTMIAFYGMPLDYLDHYQEKVQAVTVDDVKQAFSRRVRPTDLITVTVAAD